MLLHACRAKSSALHPLRLVAMDFPCRYFEDRGLGVSTSVDGSFRRNAPQYQRRSCMNLIEAHVLFTPGHGIDRRRVTP